MRRSLPAVGLMDVRADAVEDAVAVVVVVVAAAAVILLLIVFIGRMCGDC